MKNKVPQSAVVESFERQILQGGNHLVEKWKHFLDAEGLPAVEGAYNRYVLARMLETQNTALTNEAVQTTSTVFGQNYVKTMLGMTRQIFPRMFGTQLVSVQPFDRPSGTIFHLSTTRDDGSSLGVRPQDNASLVDNPTAYGVSRTYADHASGEAGAIAKSMALNISQTNVTIGQAKKLKTEASWELETDLAAVHGLSALDILQSAAVDEIAQEKDAAIVKAVRDAAIANGTVTFGPAPAGYPVEKWPQRLQRAILEAELHVQRKSRRTPNVMIVGSEAFLELQDLNTYTMAPDTDWAASTYGVLPVGSLSGKYQVFLSHAIPANEILLGRRGQGFLDAGIVYAPYVDLFISDRVFDVTVQKTVQSFASRFEIFTVSTNLYSRVVLDPQASAGIAKPSS